MTKHEQNHLNLAINTRKTLCYLSKANRMILELEVTIIKRLKVTYANNQIWICHSVIARFITDYEE